ncbi:hypothetical protein HH216_01350 [Spirosoma rhododendri]|uniref:Helix-turn-helix domain-containing protein n=1 Tax=Spirosoma rhododendri TaxID=2728024 RepID=A0A7L5DV21_9BACT|nr:hypothetical protein HH216_01350 [Spirosoma rhododendri]
MGDAIRDRSKELIETARRESDESLRILTEAGITLDTSQWLTIKRYAERYGITMQVVTNWISRGIIPADCTMTVPELNDLRLVKNQAYR